MQALQIFIQRVGAEHPYTQETVNRLVRFIRTLMQVEQVHLLSDHPIIQNLFTQIQTDQSHKS